MIREADCVSLNAFHTTDPFFTRILSLYESYGEGYAFTGFWVQEVGGDITAAVSRFEDVFSLYLTDAADLAEITAFLRFQGADSVMFDQRFALDLPAEREICGQVLAYRGVQYISELELYEPEIPSYYRLLESCASERFRVPAYLPFLSDVRHRLNRGKCRLLGTDVDGTLASGVMTVSETERAVILGAVATRPAYRRRGLSRELVRTLASQFARQDRAVYVFSASGEHTRFYERSGFAVIADFSEKMQLW